MGVKERLIQFVESKMMTIKAFQNSIGVSGSYVTNISNSIGASILKRITEVYPELNTKWLLEGEGEMLQEVRSDLVESRTVLVLPVAAQAGRLTDFVTSVYARDCERMISPVDDVEFAVPVTGESMAPEYPNGSRAFVKKINEKAFIDWGRTFVLDTCNGVVIKNVFPGTSDDRVRCVSVNKAFPDFEVRYEDIYGWYRVLAHLSF